MNQPVKTHLSLFTATMIFGVNYWISKELMPYYLEPLQIMFFRAFGATLLFWGVQLFFPPEKVLRKDLIIILLCSVFGVVINQTLFFVGLNLTNPVDASLIHASSPIVVVLLAWLYVREGITWTRMLGIMLGAAGAFILILQGKDISFRSEYFIGNLLILINIISYAVYLVIVKPVMAKYSPLTVMKWLFLFGFIFIFPLTIWKMDDIHWNVFTPFAWFSLIYIVLGTTIVAYLLTIYSLKFVSAAVVGYYIYLQPLIATVIAIWIFHESISIPKIVAALMIFIGVYLVNKKAQTQKR